MRMTIGLGADTTEVFVQEIAMRFGVPINILSEQAHVSR
jgi:hypothetical protein